MTRSQDAVAAGGGGMRWWRVAGVQWQKENENGKVSRETEEKDKEVEKKRTRTRRLTSVKQKVEEKKLIRWNSEKLWL